MCNFKGFELFKMNKGTERSLGVPKLDPLKHGGNAMPLALSKVGEAGGCR
jgi:hypothetical protein